jgi:hypothetical protein
LLIRPPDASCTISWEFLYLDFGMCHTITGMSRVGYSNDTGYNINGNEAGRDLHNAWGFVFSGQYTRHQRELYSSMGIDETTPNPKLTRHN